MFHAPDTAGKTASGIYHIHYGSVSTAVYTLDLLLSDIIGYAIVMFVSFCSIIAGAISLHKNGYCSDTTFSKIMVTTRNPTLDRIVKSYLGVALGADPMPKELGKLQLQFGVVDSEEESSLVKHTAFGLPEETTILEGRQGEYMQNEIELRRRRSVEMGRGGALSASGLGLGYIPG
jgi:hypothetical protein